MAKVKSNSVNASFTGREMDAIAAMLLSSNGINVDPIIEDLYPNLEDSAKSMFRCKLALLISNKLPEFQPFEGFHRSSSNELFKYRCIEESSLLGTRDFEVLERYTRTKNEDDSETWVLDKEDEWKMVGNIRHENFDYKLYNTVEEAANNW